MGVQFNKPILYTLNGYFDDTLKSKPQRLLIKKYKIHESWLN